MKKYLMLLFFSLLFINLAAQKHDKAAFSASHISRLMRNVYNLKIGQKVPTVYLHKILNYKDSSAMLSSFYQGKLLIIDFWATWCPPCIASLPALDSIQKEFPNKLRIITVTYEPEKKVRALFQKNKTVAASSLPFVVNDKWLNSLFRHRAVPHEVWIDSNGCVRAITNNYDITKKNINDIINNPSESLYLKKDNLNFSLGNFFTPNDSAILFRSLLSKPDFNIPSGSYADWKNNKYNSLKRIILTNFSILQLYYTAFMRGNSNVVDLKNVQFNIPDSSKYLFPSHKIFSNDSKLQSKYSYFGKWLRDWGNKHTFCYEQITRDYLPEKTFFDYMMHDLNRYFEVTASIKKAYRWCLVIKLTNPRDTHLLRTTGLKHFWYWGTNPGRDTLKRIQNAPISELIASLNTFQLNDPVIDGTNYKKNIDLDLNISGYAHHIKFDPDELKKDLAKYGLSVIKEYRKIDVLVINKKEK